MTLRLADRQLGFMQFGSTQVLDTIDDLTSQFKQRQGVRPAEARNSGLAKLAAAQRMQLGRAAGQEEACDRRQALQCLATA